MYTDQAKAEVQEPYRRISGIGFNMVLLSL